MFLKGFLWKTSLLICVNFLYGCQYAYHQEKEEIAHVKNMDLDNFIREKIIDSDNAVTKGVLMAFEPMSKLISVVSGGKSIQEERQYRKENFVYKALFDYRYHSLTKPKNDLKLFCNARGGILKSTYINRVNLADNLAKSPILTYVNAMRENVSGLSTEIKITPNFSIPVNISREEIAQFHAEMADARNRSSGIYTAQKSIQSAIDQESFGKFTCVTPEKKELWSVEIIPFLWEGERAVLAGTPLFTMYLGVIPKKAVK